MLSCAMEVAQQHTPLLWVPNEAAPRAESLGGRRALHTDMRQALSRDSRRARRSRSHYPQGSLRKDVLQSPNASVQAAAWRLEEGAAAGAIPPREVLFAGRGMARRGRLGTLLPRLEYGSRVLAASDWPARRRDASQWQVSRPEGS